MKIRSVCLYGSYDISRGRNRILFDGLKSCGIEIHECHANVWEEVSDKSQLLKSTELLFVILRYLKIIFLPFRYFFTAEHDIIIIPYLGIFDVFLIALPARLMNKKICYDAYLSIYALLVEDRKYLKPGNPLARIVWRMEKSACNIADCVLLDTQAHINYYTALYKTSKAKFRRSFIGADTELFSRKNNITDNKIKFDVLFWGLFIPLQGVDIIIRAAKILEKTDDIQFTIIGKGQTYDENMDLAKSLKISNISWEGFVRPQHLMDYIQNCDVGLGIFGATEKAQLVIPNKAYEIIACNKPLITADTPAIRELFSHGQNAFLVPAGNPQKLAEAILTLKEDSLLRNRIAEAGYRTFEENATPERIGKTFLKEISDKL
jgi:glycosyltransferase involved in cell wall biosynthesis